MISGVHLVTDLKRLAADESQHLQTVLKLTIVGAFGNDRVTAFIGAPKYPIEHPASLERVVQGPARR